MEELPKFIGLQCKNYNNKYLRYVYEDNEAHGLQQFSSDTVVSGYAKFQVEKAKMGKGYVHIRSLYNNKYWVRRSPTEFWITANADEPDENEFTWTCTLFEPIPVDGCNNSGLTIRLRHVNLSHYLCLWRIPPPYEACMFAASPDHDESRLDIFTVFDWDSLFVLPKFIAFKGDNGKYLRKNRFQGMNYLTFDMSDISDSDVKNKVFPTSFGDGTVAIESVSYDNFWSREHCDHWVVAGSCNCNANDPNSFFFPVKISKNVVALRNLGDNLFCKRYDDKGVVDGLSAISPTITLEAKLEVYELVSQRAIGNVEFHLLDGRIYDKKVITVATGFAENRSDQPDVIAVKLSYNNTRVSAWSSTVSVKLNVETCVIESSIPIIFEETLAIGPESFSGEYDWGEDKNLTKKVETVHKVLVQPCSKVRVNLVATQASYDVPFSYTQNDTLISSNLITTYKMEDGIYKGVNLYNFKFEETDCGC
ncbi:uncharacterized protein LOC103498962 [Cucumis melo]|uniref:Uncharacterized protein LOC103498962 n=1 Tax=Cucumis melo TaxID=3656 RepID=A0A1S3CB39_CUCME|nr:uncharacterized protein LOC103498962 [Cucumis melo]